MTIDVLKKYIQSSHINFLYGSGLSRPYWQHWGILKFG